MDRTTRKIITSFIERRINEAALLDSSEVPALFHGMRVARISDGLVQIAIREGDRGMHRVFNIRVSESM